MKSRLDKLENLWKDVETHKKIHKSYKAFLAHNTKSFSSRENELKAISDFIVLRGIDLDKFVLKFYLGHRYDPITDYQKEEPL